MQPQNSNDPYGFIMNSSGKSPRQPLSMQKRLMVVAVGGVLLIILLIIVVSVLNSGGNAQRDRYVEIAQKQTEIIRISTIGSKKAKTINARSFAVTTRLGLESSQRKTNELIVKRGIKDKDLSKLLAQGQNAKIDAELETAEKNNRLDETFLTIMQAQLSDYQKLINQASSGASKAEKKVLENSFAQVATLQKKDEPNTPVPEPIEDTTESGDASEDFLEEDFLDEGFEEEL